MDLKQSMVSDEQRVSNMGKTKRDHGFSCDMFEIQRRICKGET